MEKHYQVIIIGAGIAGLSCAKYLLENNIQDFLIVEAQNEIGGRCRTIPLRRTKCFTTLLFYKFIFRIFFSL